MTLMNILQNLEEYIGVINNYGKKMVRISIDETNKNQKLGEVCGECNILVNEDFARCKDCNMVLCNECGDNGYCSSCWRDKNVN